MSDKNYTNYYQKKFQGDLPPSQVNFGSGTKKAVKHFTDLEVYQRSLAAAVFAAKLKNKNKSSLQLNILVSLTACALSIPHLIAEAHSQRFGTSEQSLLTLDKVMLHCNKMVVYLELTRDLCSVGLELDQFNEQIKKYFFIRQKVLNLQRVWRKYIQINRQQKVNFN